MTPISHGFGGHRPVTVTTGLNGAVPDDPADFTLHVLGTEDDDQESD